MKLIKLLFKIIMGLIVTLAILLVIGAFVLVKMVDPNQFKPQIISAVNQATGRTLTLSGDLSWDFYPIFGVHIGNAALSNPAGFSQPTFASMQSADLSLNMDDLFNHKITVTRLTINGLQLALIQKAKQNNWSFPDFMNSSDASTTGEGSSMAFAIQKVSLNNANITYDNTQTHSHYEINNLDFSTNNFDLNQSFPIQAQGSFMINQDLTGDFKMDTIFKYDAKADCITLNPLSLQTDVQYINNANTPLEISLKLSETVVLNFQAQTLSVNNIQFLLNQVLNGQGSFQLSNFTTPSYSGGVSIPTFSLKALLESLGKPAPNLPNATVLDQVAASTTFKGTMNALDLNPFELSVDGSKVTGELHLQSFSPFRLKENIAIDQLDLADYTELNGMRLPLEGVALFGTLDVQSFDPIHFPSTLNASQHLTIQNVTLQGFDLTALIASLDQMAANVANLDQVNRASAQIQNQLSALQSKSQNSHNAGNGQATNFGALRANIQIQNGVVTTPLLTLIGPLVQATGTGSIDLNQEKMNYAMTIRGLAANKNMIRNLTIPYTLSGPFNNLQQGVDWNSIQAQIMQYLVNQLGRGVAGIVKGAVELPGNVVGGVAKGAVQTLTTLFGGGGS